MKTTFSGAVLALAFAPMLAVMLHRRRVAGVGSPALWRGATIASASLLALGGLLAFWLAR